jgi:hypothetical protein
MSNIRRQFQGSVGSPVRAGDGRRQHNRVIPRARSRPGSLPNASASMRHATLLACRSLRSAVGPTARAQACGRSKSRRWSDRVGRLIRAPTAATLNFFLGTSCSFRWSEGFGAGALYNRRTRRRAGFRRCPRTDCEYGGIRSPAAGLDHSARLRTLDPAGAGPRGQRRHDPVPAQPRLNAPSAGNRCRAGATAPRVRRSRPAVERAVQAGLRRPAPMVARAPARSPSPLVEQRGRRWERSASAIAEIRGKAATPSAAAN